MRRRGSIRELPSGRYEASVAVGRRSDGRIRRHSKTFSDKGDAEEWIAEESVRMGAVPSSATLRDAWEMFSSERQLATKTTRGYRWHVEGLWAPLLGKDVSEITTEEIQALLLTTTRDNAMHARAVLSSILSFCAKRGLLGKNPMLGHRFDMPKGRMEDSGDWDDPFSVIEEQCAVWDAITAFRCLGMIRGLPLETAWLSCIGAGLRIGEALALRRRDLRRVSFRDVEVTQAAVHRSKTSIGEVKSTKTRQSIRIVTYLEPFGGRMWEIVRGMAPDSQVCEVSAQNQNKRWRNYFEEPPKSKHAPKSGTHTGALHGLPYLSLARMRNSHETLLQEMGVLDSLNASMHGHSEGVARRHYMLSDGTDAVIRASERLASGR